jgi:hypothetical protein
MYNQPGVPQPMFAPLPQRPGGPKVLGVLSIIFGSLITLSSLVGILFADAFRPKGIFVGEHVERAFADFYAATHTVSMLQGAVFLILSIALIVIGTGQLGYKAWARRASVTWSVIAFVVLAGAFFVYLLVTGPATARMMDTMRQDMGGVPNMGGFIGGAASVLMLVFYAPYPIILLVSATRPATIAAMKN